MNVDDTLLDILQKVLEIDKDLEVLRRLGQLAFIRAESPRLADVHRSVSLALARTERDGAAMINLASEIQAANGKLVRLTQLQQEFVAVTQGMDAVICPDADSVNQEAVTLQGQLDVLLKGAQALLASM